MSYATRPLLGALSVFALLAGPARGEDPLAQSVVQRVKKSTAFVDGKNGHGSGFVVLPNVIATNAHVIRDEVLEDVVVRFVDGTGEETKYHVRLLYEGVARDLALLRVTEPLTDRPPLEIAAAFDRAATPDVYVVGNPGQAIGDLALLNSVVPAKCEDALAMMWGKPYLRLTCDVTKGATAKPEKPQGREETDPRLRLAQELSKVITVGAGNSGGPVVDRTGKLVGVLTAGLTNGLTDRLSGQFFCIPASAVRAAVDGLPSRVQWDDQVRRTTARHYLNVAMANAYLQVRTADAFIAVRVQVARTGRWGPELYQLDKQLIELYQATDKDLQARAAAAVKFVRTNAELSTAQRKELQEYLEQVEPLRSLARRPHFDGPDYRQLQAKVAKCRDRFRKFNEANGLSTRRVDEEFEKVLSGLELRG